MSLFLRKIERGKWEQNNALNGGVVSADAITSLRTQNNDLSFWEIEDESEIEEVFLAISSNLQHLESIDIVPIDESIITSNFTMEPTPGETKYTSFSNHHFDMKNLDYNKLGDLSNIIINAINSCKSKGQKIRKTRTEIKKILLKGLEDNKIKENELENKLIEELSK